MNIFTWAAMAIVLVAGPAKAEDGSVEAAMLLHSTTHRTCGFRIKPESAVKAAVDLKLTHMVSEPMLQTIIAICKEVKRGNRDKVLTLKIRDDRGVTRQIKIEKGHWLTGL